MPPPRLLLVEDDFLIRLTLADALTEAGFDVTEAATGDAALAILGAAGRFALLVTDIRLPGALSGLQLADAAREADPLLPVLFMTGRPDLARDRAGPHEAIVAKPYLPSEICRTARRLLRS